MDTVAMDLAFDAELRQADAGCSRGCALRENRNETELMIYAAAIRV
jgi:hypothetical protein